MDETDGRLAPGSYLFGARPSASSVPRTDETADDHEPHWNDAWGADRDGSRVQLSDAERHHTADAERIAMKALGRRAHSRREIERLLRDGGIDEAGIAYECDRLARVGLIDDAALAQNLVATLQERKGLGRTAIAAELT